MLLDDLVISLAAGISTTSLVIMFVLLVRYRAAVNEAGKASNLAKSVIESMNARLSTQDTRIVDLMARLEVYSTRQKPATGLQSHESSLAMRSSASPDITRKVTMSQQISPTQLPTQASVQRLSQVPQPGRTTSNSTETTILRALMEGPKMPGQIKAVISAAKQHEFTREHTARLLKGLYEKGLVVRNDNSKPFVYEITDAGRNRVGEVQ